MLTQRQLQLLKFIEEFSDRHGVSPSFEEMRAALRLRSKSGIHRLISGLEERGYVRRLAYRARALELVRTPGDPAVRERLQPVAGAVATNGSVEEPQTFEGTNIVRGNFRSAPRTASSGRTSAQRLPICGRIAAGSPIEALAESGSLIDVPSLMLGDGEHYVVQVVGDSMVDAGIIDGDYAVIQRCETADNGSIVVALIEEREVTLKRLRRRGASIALEPANALYETRIFGPHQVRLQGRLVGLLRRY